MDPQRYLRSFQVLHLLVGQQDGLRLVEIRQALGLAASSAHNMLSTMVETGLLEVSRDLHYTLGPRAIGLSLATVNTLDIRALARPHLRELALEVGEDVYLGLQMGRRVFYADRILGPGRVSLDVQLGVSLYLHSTATGKLFAALDPALEQRALAGPLPQLTPRTLVTAPALAREFEQVRAAGWAASREETVEGISGYSVPVRRSGGSPAAAVHVSVIGGREAAATERRVLEAARTCALAIEQALVHAPHHPSLHKEYP